MVNMYFAQFLLFGDQLTKHEACLNERKPAVDIHEALAYTVPGVIAHESALKGGISMEIPQFD